MKIVEICHAEYVSQVLAKDIKIALMLMANSTAR
jgi:hypothetical protein